jgi:hypothetical protein
VAVKEPRAVILEGTFILDRHDVLEYFACPLKNGKLHETVIAVDADPAALNVAMIALGYESGGGVEVLGDPSVPRGDRVRMFVEWDWNEAEAVRRYLEGIEPAWKRPGHDGVREKVGEGVISWEPGQVVRVRAEDTMFNHADGHPMLHTDWIYSGSGFIRDEDTGRHLYKAALEGVLAAVYRDPAAVFNTPLRTGEDDVYYSVRDSVVPPRGTRCLLIVLPAEKDGPPEG